MEDSTTNTLPYVILNTLPFGVFVDDTYGKVRLVNSYLKSLFDITHLQEFEGNDSRELLELLGSRFKNRTDFQNRIDSLKFEGMMDDNPPLETNSNKFIYLKRYPLIDGSKKIGCCWCFQNIALQDVIETEKPSYDNILKNIPADILAFNADQHVLFSSSFLPEDNFSETATFTHSVDAGASDGTENKFQPLLQRYFNEQRANAGDTEWEEDYHLPDGKNYTILRKFRATSQSRNLIVSCGIDITSLKKQISKLREDVFCNKTLLHQLREIILTVDERGLIKSLNPAWEKITGHSVSDTIGRDFSDFLAHFEVKSRFAGLVETERLPELTNNPICIVNAFGELRWLEGYSGSLSNESGNFSGFYFVFSDITVRKHADDELLSLVQKERELNELKSQFVNMVSHEIRTPLAGILSSVELLEIIHKNNTDTLKERSFKHFSSIKEQVIRLGTLMDNVLLLGKIEAGKMQLNLQETDLVTACRSALEEDFNRRIQKIGFSVQGDPYLIPLDWNLIKHVVNNLVGNAIKYSEGQQMPEFSIIFKRTEINLEIKDYGIGIPKSELGRIFMPFSRASNVGNIDGTGLGLMLSLHFVKMHNGIIDIRSEEGFGSTFTVRLPVK